MNEMDKINLTAEAAQYLAQTSMRVTDDYINVKSAIFKAAEDRKFNIWYRAKLDELALTRLKSEGYFVKETRHWGDYDNYSVTGYEIYWDQTRSQIETAKKSAKRQSNVVAGIVVFFIIVIVVWIFISFKQ